MLPPGLSFNAVSAKALAANATAAMPRSYWDWHEMMANNKAGYFPYTPATNLLYGLREALAMLQEEGLPNVFARHARHAAATRAAVRAWGLDILCLDAREYSNVLTAVVMPDGHDADALRATDPGPIRHVAGHRAGRVKGRVFRIGHLGDFNDLTLMGTLCGGRDGACTMPACRIARAALRRRWTCWPGGARRIPPRQRDRQSPASGGMSASVIPTSARLSMTMRRRRPRPRFQSIQLST